MTAFPPGERPCHCTSTSRLHLWGIIPNDRRVSGVAGKRLLLICTDSERRRHTNLLVYVVMHARTVSEMHHFYVYVLTSVITHNRQKMFLFSPSSCRTIHVPSTTSFSRIWITTKQGEPTWWTSHGKTHTTVPLSKIRSQCIFLNHPLLSENTSKLHLGFETLIPFPTLKWL